MTDTQLASSLREKLGSESAGRWIDFMDLIGHSLPFLLRSAGRPTNEEIASSAIGAAGFKSWRDMVEHSPAWGGLGWSYDTYKAWKKAYSLVLRHPYLRDLSLSSSEINTIQRENKEFPASLEAFKALKETRKDAQEERRLNSVASLQKQLSTEKAKAAATNTTLEASRASEAQLKSLCDQLRKDLSLSNEEKGALQVQLERSNNTISKQKTKIDNLEDQKQKLEKKVEHFEGFKRANEVFGGYLRRHVFNASRWELFKAFMRGSVKRPSKEVSEAMNRKS